jgi:hypothetical protein
LFYKGVRGVKFLKSPLFYLTILGVFFAVGILANDNIIGHCGENGVEHWYKNDTEHWCDENGTEHWYENGIEYWYENSTKYWRDENNTGYCDENGIRILMKKTEHGNFEKRKLINELTYVLSYGRDSIEYVIDTIHGPQSPSIEWRIDWESDKFISLARGCGTYCWTNAVLPLHKKKSVMYFSYSAFDAKNHRIVEINSKGDFVISDLFTKKTMSISSQYNKFRKDGYPLFFIDIIQFNDSLLTYNIRKKDGSNVSMKIKFRE